MLVEKMRHCRRCDTTKPDSAFYRPTGRICKDCHKDQTTARRWANIDTIRQKDRDRGSRPERMRGMSAKYMQEHPLKAAAHRAVKNALRRGDLVRGPCEVCGKQRTDGHHDDYSKPLEVRWLCRVHHAAEHTS